MPDIKSININGESWDIMPKKASYSSYGVVKVGDGLLCEDGVLSVYVDRYPIVYELDGGSATNAVSYLSTDEITLNAPTKTGYTFVGWTGSNGETPQLNVTIPYGTTGNLYYVANYTINTYDVTFNVDGITSTVSVNYGGKVSKPSAPTKNGYDFDCWKLNGEEFDFNTVITGDIILAANWNLVTYNITYNLNGGTASNPTTYTIESSAITLNNPIKDHYDFSGWTGENGSSPQTTVIIPTGSYGDKTYTANYTLKTYTVEFVQLFVTKNGDTISSSVLSTENVTWGNTVTIVPTATNVTFYSSDLLWYNSDKTTLFDRTAPIMENKLVYVIYERESITYGFKIAKNDSNPDTRVTYTDDAVGMTPASMNYSTGVFNYGDWADAWFVKDNYPVALKYDGTEDYKLNPNDYSKKIDGTASNYNSTSYGGNMMSAMPKVYFYRYEDSDYRYCKISDTKIDNNYQCYAHIGTDGNEKDYVYLPMFKGSYVSSKLRSIGGQTPSSDSTADTEKTYAEANGSGLGYQFWDFSMHEMITDLLILISKSTNTQSKFGQGWTNSSNSAKRSTGNLYNKGQFWGESAGSNNVKVFHIEDFWGNRWDRCLGYMINNRVAYIKPTPPYVLDSSYSSTYTNCGSVSSSNGYITAGSYKNNYGFIPTVASGGSTSTYESDYVWASSGLCCAVFGGAWYSAGLAGAFCQGLTDASSDSRSYSGASLCRRKG